MRLVEMAFPTAVGMNRTRDAVAVQIAGVPRSRGDEPLSEFVALGEMWRSPQPWG